jgi:hypothetical protein
MDRRFWRDTGDITPDIFIHNDVTNDDDLCIREPVYTSFEFLRVLMNTHFLYHFPNQFPWIFFATQSRLARPPRLLGWRAALSPAFNGAMADRPAVQEALADQDNGYFYHHVRVLSI